jgi:hypothetical protein
MVPSHFATHMYRPAAPGIMLIWIGEPPKEELKEEPSIESAVLFTPEPTFASDVWVTSSDQKQFLLHSQILQMKSKVRPGTSVINLFVCQLLLSRTCAYV